MPPLRRDRMGMLKAHRLAMLASEAHEGKIFVSHPRLSGFPPIREHTVPTSPAVLQPIMENDLVSGEVHRGRSLVLTTISSPSVNALTVTTVAEDDASNAVRLVLHYFTTDELLPRVAKLLPKGTRLCIKEPYFQQFPDGGSAVCCSQPANLVIQLPIGMEVEPQSEALLQGGRFKECFALLEQQLHDAESSPVLQFQRAEAAVGMGRYREAAQILLKIDTAESSQKAREVFQRIRENEKGEYDFISIHKKSLEGPVRFSCAPFMHPHIVVRDSEGRGKGVFATNVHTAGDLLVGSKAEHILFNCDISGREMCFAPGWDDGGEDSLADTLLMRKLAWKAVIAEGHALLDLSRGQSESTTSSDEAALIRLLQVVKANRFTALKPWEGPVLGTGLWLLPSRFNHACDANCTWYNIGDMLFVSCQRDIAIGDELTVAYCNPTDDLESRQEFLQSNHGFVCSCGLCQAQRDGDVGAENYEYEVARAQKAERAAKEGRSSSSLRFSLESRRKAFEFLDKPEYCSQRHTQVEHALAAYIACDRLKQPEAAKRWLEAAKNSFGLQWGKTPGVFELFAQERGIEIGKDVFAP